MSEPSQITDMDGWQHVVSFANDWQRCQVWVQRQPAASEEFIEHIVCLTVSIGQTTADHVDLQVLIELGGRHGEVLNCLDLLVLWEGNASGEVRVIKTVLAVTNLSACPREDGGEQDEDLLFVLLLLLVGPQDLDNLLGLVQVSPAQKIDDDDITANDRLSK